MPTITATVDATHAAVRVEVDWSTTASVAYAAVRRIVGTSAGAGSDADRVPVRLSYHQPHPAGVWALLSGGRAVFFDTEAPLDQPVTYTTDSPDTTTTAITTPVTVPSGEVCWLKDPLRPAASVRLTLTADRNPCTTGGGIYLTNLGEETYPADTTTFDLVNTPRPVTASSRRKDATSSLSLVTRTLTDRDQVQALLAPGTPLLLQAPPVYGVDDSYLVVGDLRISRISPDHRRPWRRISAPYTVVDPPVGFAQGVPDSRWTDLCATYPTWATLTATGATWSDLLRRQVP